MQRRALQYQWRTFKSWVLLSGRSTKRRKNRLLRSQSSIFPAFTFFIFPQAFSSIKDRFLWRAVPFVRLIHFKCKNSNLLRLLGLVSLSHFPLISISSLCLSFVFWFPLAEKVKQRLIRGVGGLPSGKVGWTVAPCKCGERANYSGRSSQAPE